MEQPPSPPLGETPLASPVTVMHPCGCAEGIRAPSRCQHARTMRAEATVVLLNAYCQLVRHANWCATDIHETEARRTPAFRDVVVRSPEQDALGVLAGANAVMRYVLSDDALLEHNLDIEVRYWLAAILFSVYKVKTEERWEQGHSMTMLVLEQFLLVHELGEWRTCPHTRADHERRMWTAEATLIADQPFGALVDRGVHGAFEVACAQLMQLSVLTERDGELAVGLVHFYLHATYVNAKRDLLEELCADLGTEGVGAALALIVLASVRLKSAAVGTALDLSVASGLWHYDARVLTGAACALVCNAELVCKRQRPAGAYSHSSAYVYTYVNASMLQMLMNTLSGSVLA